MSGEVHRRHGGRTNELRRRMWTGACSCHGHRLVGRILLLLGHELASGARELAVEVGGPDDEVDALITGVLGLQNLGK